VIYTYLSPQYICYNYCGPVHKKLNFEALQVLRQCEPPSVPASGRNLVTHNISVLSVDHYVIQGLKLCLEIAVIQIKITPLGNNLELTIYFTLYVPN